jgi:hypothetical protein
MVKSMCTCQLCFNTCVELLTTVSSKTATVELLCKDHGGPAEIDSILVNRLSKGKLSQLSDLCLEYNESLTHLSISNHRRESI